MALMLWILLAVAALAGGALASMTTVPARRTGGAAVATAAVAGLLMLLGLDLPAAAWLGVGGAATLLSMPAGHQPDRGPAPSGPRPDRASLLGGGLAAALLFAVLYRTVLHVDWRPQPPGDVAGQSAVTGGRLLTEDLALLALAATLLTVALAVTGARGRGQADHVDPTAQADPADPTGPGGGP